MSEAKQTVRRAMDALFERHDEQATRASLNPTYIQHNPRVPTGLEPILGLLPALKRAEFGYTLHRIIADGPLVATHTTYHNADVFGAKRVVAFDLWRVEGERVAEHWDSITPLVSESVSGRSQVDGPSAASDLDATEANKALVSRFVSEVLIGDDWSRITDFIADDVYAQHNPLVADGPTALCRAVETLKIERVHRVVGEGDFVLTQSEGTRDRQPCAFYDLFRVERSKIVEHWDVLQNIPSTMAHTNGMF